MENEGRSDQRKKKEKKRSVPWERERRLRGAAALG
jgi:hypothetical protein